MDFEEYQKAAIRTANSTPRVYSATELRMLNWTLGLCGEAGEFAEIVKKSTFHGHKLDYGKATKEIGDVLWYLANLCEELDIDLGQIAWQNIQKLKARYPEGFSTERSINRSAGESAERAHGTVSEAGVSPAEGGNDESH